MKRTAPPPPRRGEPCNGCGLCCVLEVCAVGLALDAPREAPCALLSFDEGESRFRCGAVLAAPPNVKSFLMLKMGIGMGCDADLPDEVIAAGGLRVSERGGKP